MKLIITRHGETEENKAGILQGHLPGKLSVTGINQAKKVAIRLKDEKIDFIFSSDLARASDTAKEIANFHSDVPIEFVKDLREENFGEFQGEKRSDFDWDTKDYVQAKNVETMEELFNRAESFFHKVILKHNNDTILFVGHNGINKALIAVITGKRSKDILDMENQHNTSVSIFEINKAEDYKILYFNCAKHLG